MTIRKSRAAVVAVAALVMTTAAVVVAPPAGAQSRCFGRRATKVGGRGGDVIRGTRGRDVIVSRGGDDFIDGRGGNDLICAGGGNDLVSAGAGDDKVKGQAGIDILFGMGGGDVLKVGGGVVNILAGGPGGDRLVGAAGLDIASFFDSRNGVTVDLVAGVAAGQGGDKLRRIDAAEGSPFDDSLTGTAGSNQLVGLGGNDTLISGGNAGDLSDPANPNADVLFGDGDPEAPPGNDTFQGGAGVNIVVYFLSSASVNANLAEGNATGEGADTLTGIQVLVGSDFNDTLTGDDQDNAFLPLTGNDTITGAGGEDVALFTLSENGVVADLTTGTATGEGTDTFTGIEHLWGSDEADRLTGDGGPNDLYGFGGADQLAGAAGDDLLDGGPGNDSADGGDGIDTCAAEMETNCEASPAPRSLSPWPRFGAQWPTRLNIPARWQNLVALHLRGL